METRNLDKVKKEDIIREYETLKEDYAKLENDYQALVEKANKKSSEISDLHQLITDIDKDYKHHLKQAGITAMVLTSSMMACLATILWFVIL